MRVNSLVPEAKGVFPLKARKILGRVKRILVGNNKLGGFVQ